MQPETKYAWLGPDRIAYQVLGDGPPDLVVSFGFFGQVDIAWEDPGLALFFRFTDIVGSTDRPDSLATGARARS